MADERTVYERMVSIVSELPAIGKNQKNKQQNFMFRGHDDVLNALNPLLSKHGVICLPDVVQRLEGQRTTAKGSIMFVVNLHVRYRFYGEAGDCVEASVWGEGTDMGDKATNKAMTMAFKNVLNQAFAISTEEFKDADGETPEHSRATPPDLRVDPELPVPKSVAEVETAWLALGLDAVWLAQAREVKPKPSVQKMGTVLHRLWEQGPRGPIGNWEKEQVQAAFAAVLDGAVLDGPEEMSQEELDRMTAKVLGEDPTIDMAGPSQ